MRRRAVALLIACAASAGTVTLLLREPGPDRGNPELPVPSLPSAPAPAFSVPAPAPLHEPRPSARWAPVVGATAVRSGPSPSSRVAGELDARTPEGTANVVLVLGKRVDARGGLWIEVAMPGLPGHTRGWVPRPSLGPYHAVRTRLVVDLGRLSATLLLDGRSVFRSPIGVGATSSPTPRGDYYVRNRLTSFTNRFYGPLAFGTSARSPSVTDWPDGGFVGIHGTDRPDLLPGRVSHGCIRLRNEDIERLGRLMPVGTPISIR